MTDHAHCVLRLGAVLAAVTFATACGPSAEDSAPSSRTSGGPCFDGGTVRWIVPFSPGGGYDVYSRLLEPFYEQAIGAEIVIENRAGAGGRVGARLIRDAAPDGRTMGLAQGADLIIEGLLGRERDLHPTEDFTAIGRIGVAAPVLMAASDSPYRSWDELSHADRPVVWGSTDVGDSSWTFFVGATELLGLDATLLAGYPGARETSLGLIRGEMDVAAHTFESVRDRVLAGDLIPLAQVSAHQKDYPELRAIPALAGPNGLAARHARERGEDAERAAARAAALDRIFQVGRIVVAPPGLDPPLAQCLRDRFAEVTRDSGFVAAATRANRTLAYAHPDSVAAELAATATEREALGILFQRSVEAMRAAGAGR